VNAAPTATLNNAAGLAIYGTGVLDLNNQSLLTASPAANVEGMLENGYNGGAWNGTAGGSIMSTAASLTDPAARWTLGYATGGDDVSAAVIPLGQTLVKYTIPGDADLSGSVDFNDFLSLQNGYERLAGDWARGDFNYDGVVDYNDYLILQVNYGRTPTGVDASIGAAPDLVAPTPEPAALSLVASCAAGLLARGRRSGKRRESD
jgi:hypothetical protein